tara:strand:+ start:80 stop:316 length:237 start_codon:yes stop_codon:yes gene_type:complete
MIINRKDAIVIFTGVMIMALGALIGGWISITFDPLLFFESTPVWWNQAKNIFIVIGGSISAVGYWIPYKMFLEKWVVR